MTYLHIVHVLYLISTILGLLLVSILLQCYYSVACFVFSSLKSMLTVLRAGPYSVTDGFSHLDPRETLEIGANCLFQKFTTVELRQVDAAALITSVETNAVCPSSLSSCKCIVITISALDCQKVERGFRAGMAHIFVYMTVAIRANLSTYLYSTVASVYYDV